MNKKSFKKGEIIFHEGDESDSMFSVVSGTVGIYSQYGTPKQKLLTKLGVECFFGEMGLIEDLPRSATAVALESGTMVCIILPEDFNEYFKTRPAKVLSIMQNMSRRIRELTKDYMDACRVVTANAETDGTIQGKQLEDLERYAENYHRPDSADKN